MARAEAAVTVSGIRAGCRHERPRSHAVVVATARLCDRLVVAASGVFAVFEERAT